MKADNHNTISMVYDNDTVDFGTIDIKSTSSSVKKDDGTQVETDSETADEPSNSKEYLPQHSLLSGCSSEYSSYLESPADAIIIDNRKNVYIPVRLNCGVCAHCSPDVLKHCPMVLRSIQADLRKAFSLLPVSVHSLLRRTNLWLNYNGYAYGPKANPRILRHITTHHHPSWLMDWACDTPQKAMGIEIYSCVDFQTMRLHWNGSGLLLHEFCHLIHQCCLEDGLENKTIEALYETADASGKYGKVLRRDWAGKTRPKSEPDPVTGEQEVEACDSDLAYAMVDPKEFFAELSVAYFCTSYKSLDKQDPTIMEACSPPLLHPDATKRVKSLIVERQRENTPIKKEEQNKFYPFLERVTSDYQLVALGEESKTDEKEEESIDCWTLFPPLARFVKNLQQKLSKSDEDTDPKLVQWQRLADSVFRERALNRNCANTGHCNKFYPFTRGQLKQHDPELLRELAALWREIAMWEDPFASIRTRQKLERSCLRLSPGFSDCC